MRSAETQPSPTPDIRLTGWWAIGVLFALVLLTYAPAMMAGYIWDDDEYVTDNVQLQTTEGLWRIWFEPGATPQYYPMVFTTFWVEHQLWGINPAGYHLVNILLHALNAVLLFRILRMLEVPGALFAAGLFAVAPVHVESVAWISERKNVLSGMFYLTAFLAYWRFVGETEKDDAPQSLRRWGSYALSLVLYGCALMSKSVTCSLPAAILLVLWWKKGRLTIQTVLPLVPMFAVGIAAGVNTILMEKHHVGAEGLDWDWTLLERFLIAGRVLWFYVWKTVWPQPLIFIYPKWQIDATVWWQYIFLIAAVVLVVWLWISRERFGRGPLVAVFFFAGTLFPALGFIDVYPMRFSFVADHFQYLASIGVISLIAAATATVASRWNWHQLASLLCAAVVLLVFARISFVRCLDYMNAETLWSVTLAQNPDCWMAKYNLGSIRFRQQRYDEAYKLMTSALRQKADDEANNQERADIHFYLGASLMALGKPDEAMAYYEMAREKYEYLAANESPPDAATHNNLGIVFGILNKPEQAIASFERALEIDPTKLDVNLNLGEMYYRVKRYDESEECFRRALEIDPRSVRALYNLGTVAWTLDRRQEAVEHMRAALKIDPGFSAARIALQQALSEQSSGSQ